MHADVEKTTVNEFSRDFHPVEMRACFVTHTGFAASHLTRERLPTTLPLRDETACLTSLVSRRTACSRFEGRTRNGSWGTRRDMTTPDWYLVKCMSRLCTSTWPQGYRGTNNAHEVSWEHNFGIRY